MHMTGVYVYRTWSFLRLGLWVSVPVELRNLCHIFYVVGLGALKNLE